MNRVINPTPLGGGGGGLVPTIRATAPIGSTVSCDGQAKVVGSEGFVDFVVSAEPVNILPDGVQGLEYIESTGTQYIDTGVDDSELSVDIEFSIVNSRADQYDNNSILASNVSGTAAKWLGLTYHPNSRNLSLGWYSNSQLTLIASTVFGEKYSLSFTVNKNPIIFNGNPLNVPGTHTLNQRTLYLFRSNSSYAQDTGYSIARVYSLKMKKGEAPVRDFIPIRRDSDNAVGMYDLVSGQFFGNQGTGLFIAGEPKEWLDFPTYTVTVNGASQMVKVDKVGLFFVLFN